MRVLAANATDGRFAEFSGLGEGEDIAMCRQTLPQYGRECGFIPFQIPA